MTVKLNISEPVYLAFFIVSIKTSLKPVCSCIPRGRSPACWSPASASPSHCKKFGPGRLFSELSVGAS
ncbi:hypothetical protein E2C01_063786 [Portunus trituberculatus]|uniref:Uncharacterized protein n=1 Tax=Portunus trituberculatus TaxID=210409 RepID=A0A5B7HLH3_PORTR|nr:hypothetical protein [Portunus trituberculatus]